MFERSTSLNEDASAEIARHEVSEDGVTWRPYDAARDRDRRVHKRIVFAQPMESAPCFGKGSP